MFILLIIIPFRVIKCYKAGYVLGRDLLVNLSSTLHSYDDKIRINVNTILNYFSPKMFLETFSELFSCTRGSLWLARDTLPSKYISNKINTDFYFIGHESMLRQCDVPFKYVCCSTWSRVIPPAWWILSCNNMLVHQLVITTPTGGLGVGRYTVICLLVYFCLCVVCVCISNFGPHWTRVRLHVFREMPEWLH